MKEARKTRFPLKKNDIPLRRKISGGAVLSQVGVEFRLEFYPGIG